MSRIDRSRYLDGECAGYNHQAWMCTYWGAPGTAQAADPIRPQYTPTQAKLVLGGEVSMWGDDVNADVIEAFVWLLDAPPTQRRIE